MDDIQDIARSAYADMLHDDERNLCYARAIDATVHHLVLSTAYNAHGNSFFKCCDIGTGSGLLSMMIVRSFRKLNYEHFHVTAFEAFEPMAQTAKKIIASNGMSDKITVIDGRAENHKQNPQFILLVAELLDTELIGEGCLLTYRHAIKNLCSPDCIFVPQEARMYAQPLESPRLHNRNHLRYITFIEDVRMETDIKFVNCPGTAPADDMQLSMADLVYRSKPLAPPENYHTYKFSDIDSLSLSFCKQVKFPKVLYGHHIVIAMWWELVMYDQILYEMYLDEKEEPQDTCGNFDFCELSCAPQWIREKKYWERDIYIQRKGYNSVWREHWIQSVSYILADQTVIDQRVVDGLEFEFYINTDAYSTWITDKMDKSEERKPPHCSCGVHRLLSRTECAFVNSEDLVQILKPIIEDCPCREKKLYLDFNVPFRDFSSEEFSKLSADFDGKYRLIHPGDPSHVHRIDFSLQAEISYAKVLKDLLSGIDTRPIIRLEFMYMDVRFSALNRIRTRVGTCQGFDITHLDELIEGASKLVDSSTQSLHVFEYECYTCKGYSDDGGNLLWSVGERKPGARKAIGENGKRFSHQEKIVLDIPQANRHELKRSYAIIFWPVFHLRNGYRISGGFVDSKTTAHKLYNNYFNPNFMQIVHFLHDHPALNDDSCQQIELLVDISPDGIEVVR